MLFAYEYINVTQIICKKSYDLWEYWMFFVQLLEMLYCFFSGQTPAEADFNLLDTARKVELYGIRMHPAKVIYMAFSVSTILSRPSLEIFKYIICFTVVHF